MSAWRMFLAVVAEFIVNLFFNPDALDRDCFLILSEHGEPWGDGVIGTILTSGTYRLKVYQVLEDSVVFRNPKPGTPRHPWTLHINMEIPVEGRGLRWFPVYETHEGGIEIWKTYHNEDWQETIRFNARAVRQRQEERARIIRERNFGDLNPDEDEEAPQ